MKTTLYKDFQLLRLALAKKDITQAENLLRKLEEEQLPEAAGKLFDTLNDRFLTAGGSEIAPSPKVFTPVATPYTPDGLLSSYDERQLLEGFSLVSCCMNRNENLRKSLKSWLKLPVHEIVIVDWNSDIPVATCLSGLNDKRIRIIRVENEHNWILTYAFNVGLRFASYKKIFKLDADIETSDDFLELNHFEAGEFIRGSWEMAIEEDRVDQVYINGSFGCFKSDLLKMGFYNEHIRTYGWDDSDLYARLSLKCGLKQKYLAFGSLSHIHQEQEERLKHQEITPSTFLNEISATEITSSCNKFIVALFDQWWPSFLQNYKVAYDGDNIWSCSRTTGHREIPDSILKDAQKYAVLENLFRSNPAWSEVVYKATWMAGFIFEQYNAEISFKETASVLLLEGAANGYFENGISPYRVLRNLVDGQCDKQSPNLPHLYVFQGSNARYELNFSGLNIVVQRLDETRCLDLKEIYEQGRSQNLFSAVDSDSQFSGPNEVIGSERVLAISLYDENNPERMNEYLESLKRNLQYFDAVAIFYEKSNGEMYERIIALINSFKPKCMSNVIWISIQNRPTFEEIFNTVDFIFPHTIVVIANADIAFDSSIYEVTTEVLRDSFLVISRQEIPECTGGYSGHIMNHFGLPNTWSADAWIYQTPRKAPFRASFPVGTFHCDSFLNYHIGNSTYRLYNPCLSINTYHIHHEDFNSSEFKRLELADEISEVLSNETKQCDGEVPIRGIQWCRIKDVLNDNRADQLITWSNFIINIFIDIEGSNLISSLAIAAMSLKLAEHVEGNISVSLNIPLEIVNTELGDILFDVLQVFDNRNFNVAITNPEEKRPFVKGPETCYKASADIRSLINTYLASFSGSNETALFDTGINFKELDGFRTIGFTPHISIYFADHDSNDLTTYLMLKILRGTEFEVVYKIVSTLSKTHSVFLPFTGELMIAEGKRKNTSDRKLLDALWSPAPNKRKKSFEVTFITSIYKGSEFFRGFLENIAASAIECNGDVILVDAASPDDEKEIFTDFIEEYPGLKHRFKYICLEEDPGLYNCWKLAIEESTSEFVSNANLDDRRSPYHTAALLGVIRNNPESSGAATALRATKVKNAAWYSMTNGEFWFTNESTNGINFESLYVTNEDGNILSRNMMHCMPVWKKSLHHKYGFFNEARYGTSADWAFWLECTKHGEKFVLIPISMSMYFINVTSHNRAHDINGEKELKIIKDYFGGEQKKFIQQ